jgi:hypothetical protein
MVIQPTPLQDLSFIKSNTNVYQLGFLRFEKEKKGKDYFFTGFSRHALTDYLTHELGYYRIGQDRTYIVVQHNSGIVEEVPIHKAKNDLLEVLSALEDKTEVCDGKTIHIHRDDILDKFHNVQSTYFSPGSIDILAELKKEFMRDDATNTYFFFKNGLIRISADVQERISYDQVHDKLIWKSWIKDHDIILEDSGRASMFENFITNVAGDEPSKKGFVTAIGYMLSNFNLPSKNQAVILYDEKITDLNNPAGGTGKGILAKGLSQLRKQVIIDGKKFNTQSTFAFQNIQNDTQIIFVDDVKSGLDFKFFYSILSEGLTVEHKHKPSWKFDSKSSPKIIISSNSVLSNRGNSNKRRMFILEFSDFYSSKIRIGTEEPVRDHHGCMFFDDWDEPEWNRFFLFLMYCTREYLILGLIPVQIKGLNDNLLLQKTSEDFYEWVQEQSFMLGKAYLRDDYFIPFQQEYFGDSRDFSVKKFNKWMKDFAESKGWVYKSHRSNSINYFTISHASKSLNGGNKEQDGGHSI